MILRTKKAHLNDSREIQQNTSAGGTGMGITAKQLAEELNISAAAVSMALNNKKGVSTRTRKRVLDLAKKRGYDFSKINEAASASSSMKGTIQFIIYKRNGAIVGDTPFFSEVSEGITQGCREAHYYMGVSYYYEGEDPSQTLKDLLAAGCKGIILLGTEITREELEPFLTQPIPLVILDTSFNDIDADFICINNVQGASAATQKMIQTFHTQPGYLKSSVRISNFDERANGFYQTVRNMGMSAAKSPSLALTPSTEGAYEDLKELLKNGEQPSRCYFADNDLIAAGAIRAFQEAGYRVPEDVAVVGFDDMPVCIYTTPHISTIHVPKQFMGKTAARRIVNRIEVKSHHHMTIEISTRFIRRKSL